MKDGGQIQHQSTEQSKISSYPHSVVAEVPPADRTSLNESRSRYNEQEEAVPLVTHHDAAFKRDGLTRVSLAAYSVGHFNNDLCATAWFTYVLYYVKEVVGLPSEIAGFVMLSGQLADAITTPLVGLFSDKTETRIGKRAPWYIFGTILVIPTFLAIFIFPGFEKGGQAEIAYYITVPALFNIGNHSIPL
jgi:hypothetical protein